MCHETSLGSWVGSKQDRFRAGPDPHPVQDDVYKDRRDEQQRQDKVNVAPDVPAQTEQSAGLLGVGTAAATKVIPMTAPVVANSSRSTKAIKSRVKCNVLRVMAVFHNPCAAGSHAAYIITTRCAPSASVRCRHSRIIRGPRRGRSGFRRIASGCACRVRTNGP